MSSLNFNYDLQARLRSNFILPPVPRSSDFEIPNKVSVKYLNLDIENICKDLLGGIEDLILIDLKKGSQPSPAQLRALAQNTFLASSFIAFSEPIQDTGVVEYCTHRTDKITKLLTLVDLLKPCLEAQAKNDTQLQLILDKIKLLSQKKLLDITIIPPEGTNSYKLEMFSIIKITQILARALSLVCLPASSQAVYPPDIRLIILNEGSEQRTFFGIHSSEGIDPYEGLTKDPFVEEQVRQLKQEASQAVDILNNLNPGIQGTLQIVATPLVG